MLYSPMENLRNHSHEMLNRHKKKIHGFGVTLTLDQSTDPKQCEHCFNVVITDAKTFENHKKVRKWTKTWQCDLQFILI